MTKRLAIDHLAGTPPQSFLGDIFRLDYVENPGAFLRLGASLPPRIRTGLLTFGVAIILAIVAIMAIRRRWTGTALAGVALLWAGGISDLVDRATRGSVVEV